MSLTTLLLRDSLRLAPLVQLGQLIDWVPVETELAPFDVEHRRRRGGPTPFTPAVMFRVSLLQDWHGLSFNSVAWALHARLDFAIFAGLEPGFPVPSPSSICRARQRLEKGGARGRCRKIVDDQLAHAGIRIYLAPGTMRELRIVHLSDSRSTKE